MIHVVVDYNLAVIEMKPNYEEQIKTNDRLFINVRNRVTSSNNDRVELSILRTALTHYQRLKAAPIPNMFVRFALSLLLDITNVHGASRLDRGCS